MSVSPSYYNCNYLMGGTINRERYPAVYIEFQVACERYMYHSFSTIGLPCIGFEKEIIPLTDLYLS